MKEQSGQIRLLPPGYYATKTILRELQDYRDLILNYIPFVGYEERASRPLAEILSGRIESAQERYNQVRQRIDELIPTIKQHLSYAGVETKIKTKENVPGSMRITETEYDLIIDTFQLPNRSNARIYDMLISMIDRGIGYYKQRKKAAFRELIIPVYWVKFLLMIPIYIIQMTGVISSREASSHVLKIYTWLIRIPILIILAFLAMKLGISTNWARLVDIFK